METRSTASENSVIDIFSKEAREKLRTRLPTEELNFFTMSDFNINVLDITILDQIARGAYGIVYKGSMNGKKYAVKIEDFRVGVEEQVNLLSELTILQSLPHERLVSYQGAGYISKCDSEAKVCEIIAVII